jgi:glutamate N-acetyltransferase/amino-acid N-acetyltransferase
LNRTPIERFFQRLLDDLCMDLARQMVKDGEGVTKVVDLTVRGARSDEDARPSPIPLPIHPW